MDERITHDLALQVRVSKLLGCGFAFSIVPLSGVGSLIALIIGLRARKIIVQAETEIAGLWMAWWCITIGGFNLLASPLQLIYVLSQNLK